MPSVTYTPVPDNVGQEPLHSFDSAWLKIHWANQHVSKLKTLCNIFIQHHAYSVQMNHDPERDEYRFTVLPTQPIPVDIPLSLGDAIHNMRAALDYCWMGLYRAAKPGVTTKYTFPMAERRKDLEETLRKAPIETAFKGTNDLILNRVKPYKEGNFLLWALNKLDVRDKHNLLIPSLAVTLIKNVTITGDNVGGIHFANCNIQANKPFGLARFTGGGFANLKFEHEPETTVEIVFGKGQFVDDQPLLETVGTMLKLSAEVVQLFRKTFLVEPS